MPSDSTTSSRCGPTSDRPRCSSSGRRSVILASSSPARSLREVGASSPRRCPEIERGLVLRRRLVVGRGDVGVRLRHLRHQRVQGRQPGVQQLGAGGRQMAVPDVERRGGVATTIALTPDQRLEQGVSLPQHPVVVRPHAGQPGPARGDQLVEEPSPLGGVALDDGQVLGREHDAAQQTEDLPRTPDRRTVQLGAVGLTGCDLHLEQQLPLVVEPGVDPGPDDGPLGTGPDQWLIGGHPVRAKASRGTRPPRPGSSCPARWRRRRSRPPARWARQPPRTTGSRPAAGDRRTRGVSLRSALGRAVLASALRWPAWPPPASSESPAGSSW